MPDKIRTGIVGLGNWGKNVARELNAASELVAFASKGHSGHESWLSEHLPAVRRTTLDTLLNDQTIQAIAIATPIPFLSDLAHAALSAGKHTFVEKPLASSAEVAELLAALARRRDLILLAGYVFLYHPVYLELKRRADLQSVRAVRLEWRKFGTFAEPIEQSLLTHHLSLILDMLGEPENGRISCGPGTYSRCDTIETHLSYATLAVTSVIDRTSPHNTHRIALEMDDGSSLVWEENLLFSIDDKGGKPTIVYDDKRQPLTAEIAGFVEAAGGGGLELPSSGSFAAKVLRLLERIR